MFLTQFQPSVQVSRIMLLCSYKKEECGRDRSLIPHLPRMEAIYILEGECTKCLALKLKQGKPGIDGSCHLPSFFFLLAPLNTRGTFFRFSVLHAQFSEPTREESERNGLSCFPNSSGSPN